MKKYLSEFGGTPTAEKYGTTPSEALAWLAGIIEGEGSIANYAKKLRPGNGQYNYNRGILIVNSDERLLDRVCEIYDTLKLKYSRVRKTASIKRYPQSFRWTKPCYVISLKRIDDLRYLLPLIAPFMAGEKKQKCEELLMTLEQHRARVTTKRETPQLMFAGEAIV